MDRLLQALFVCHRLPERSFFYRGKQFPICARCTGILLGYLIGILYAVIYGRIAFYISILLLIPLTIDGSVQLAGKWKSTNRRRLLTGILAGVGTIFLLFGIMAYGFEHGRQFMRFFIQ
jgi:uncharacterized membrane protein